MKILLEINDSELSAAGAKSKPRVIDIFGYPGRKVKNCRKEQRAHKHPHTGDNDPR